MRFRASRRSSARLGAFVVALGLVSIASPLPAIAGTPGSGAAVAADRQSDEPAPASRAKTVVANVHTDAVSAFIDDGRLVLGSQADMDVTGDGVPEMAHRLDPESSLFHLSDAARIAVPDIAAYRFLGAPGDTVWMAPQTQDPGIIWPGFSTEHPSLTGRVAEGRFSVRMTDVAGPGEVEMYLQRGTAVERIFSSTTDLPAWTIAVPQHAHMNWAFRAPGTYTLTFDLTGIVDGRRQTTTGEYVFVVGDLAAHTRATGTTLVASADRVDPGDDVTLTADVDPADAVGAVQFRDLTSGTLLGHAPVEGGTAAFRTDALAPGEHRLAAEYVPTWIDDHGPSVSEPVTVTVTGKALPKPVEDDLLPIPQAELDAHAPGTAVVVAGRRTIAAGGTVTGRVADAAAAGQWVSVWVPGDAPAGKGWVQTDLRGAFSIAVSPAIPAGPHRLVVKTRAGELLGWDAFTVEAAPAPAPSAPPAAPTPAPLPAQAAPQECRPAVTLETGHIDAFFVSAADGRAVLQLVEDVTGHRVVREPEQVLLRVKPSAHRADIPVGTPGAPAGYVLPLTQSPSLIWPGWDTNRTATSGYSDVSIHITGVDGPGRVTISSQGPFGGVTSLLQGGGYTLPGVIREEVPAHTHAQWVFSAEGVYTLTAHAVATNRQSGQSIRTETRTYTFQVGDAPLGDTFCRLRPVGAADAVAVHAAVDRAAAKAVAAAQAAAEAAAAAEAEQARERERAPRAQEAETATDAAATGTPSTSTPAVAAGLIGGGILAVAGIVGATAWYVRRLGAGTGAP